MNHSCDPNLGFQGSVVLVALRDIANGEELTTDSAPFDCSGEEMTCHCGRPACRGVVTGRDWQMPALQATYAGYFSSYLQARIDGGKASPRSLRR